jgi:hypothetical protein
MCRKTTAACLLALMSLFAAATASAQTAPTPDSAFLDGVQTSVTKSIAAQDKTVEITLTGNVLTVLRVNSNQNASSHEGRNNEAAEIARVAVKAMNSESKGASVHTIRVQYLIRDSANAQGMVVDTVEFRKNAKGAFEIHVT